MGKTTTVEEFLLAYGAGSGERPMVWNPDGANITTSLTKYAREQLAILGIDPKAIMPTREGEQQRRIETNRDTSIRLLDNAIKDSKNALGVLEAIRDDFRATVAALGAPPVVFVVLGHDAEGREGVGAALAVYADKEQALKHNELGYDGFTVEELSVHAKGSTPTAVKVPAGMTWRDGDRVEVTHGPHTGKRGTIKVEGGPENLLIVRFDPNDGGNKVMIPADNECLRIVSPMPGARAKDIGIKKVADVGSGTSLQPVAAVCECKTWGSSDVRRRMWGNGHHESCHRYNPVEGIYNACAAMVKALEEWGANEDGIPQEVWEAYRAGIRMTQMRDVGAFKENIGKPKGGTLDTIA